MIKVKSTIRGGKVSIRGYKGDILSDISSITKAITTKGIASKDEIIEAVNVGCMSEEELEEAVKKKTEEFMKMIEKINEETDLSKMTFDLTNKGGKDDTTRKKEAKKTKTETGATKGRKRKTEQDN